MIKVNLLEQDWLYEPDKRPRPVNFELDDFMPMLYVIAAILGQAVGYILMRIWYK